MSKETGREPFNPTSKVDEFLQKQYRAHDKEISKETKKPEEIRVPLQTPESLHRMLTSPTIRSDRG